MSFSAPYCAPDAYHTARTITALKFLDEHFPIESLLQTFERNTHFECFEKESSHSLTANCAVLITLLHSPAAVQYTTQIKKVTTFICNECWTHEGMLQERWVCVVSL